MSPSFAFAVMFVAGLVYFGTVYVVVRAFLWAIDIPCRRSWSFKVGDLRVQFFPRTRTIATLLHYLVPSLIVVSFGHVFWCWNYSVPFDGSALMQVLLTSLAFAFAERDANNRA